MNHLKGEALNIGFDRGIKLDFHGAKVTSDGCLLAHRDLNESNYCMPDCYSNFYNICRCTFICLGSGLLYKKGRLADEKYLENRIK
jgi:hypothetical protein